MYKRKLSRFQGRALVVVTFLIILIDQAPSVTGGLTSFGRNDLEYNNYKPSYRVRDGNWNWRHYHGSRVRGNVDVRIQPSKYFSNRKKPSVRQNLYPKQMSTRCRIRYCDPCYYYPGARHQPVRIWPSGGYRGPAKDWLGPKIGEIFSRTFNLRRDLSR